MSDDPLVVTERHDDVLVVSMRRERKRNAVDRALADALSEALDQLDDDPDVRVGVLTGTTTVFSAGSDLNALGDYATERGGEYGIIRRRRSTPLIAAVEGPALGGGLEIALACDLVVAAADATFGLPEVCRGLVPTSAGLFRTLQALPRNLAKELVLTGRPVDASWLARGGLLNEVVEPGEALPAAIALATTIAANGPVAVQASLAAMEELIRALDEQGWAATDAARRRIEASDDAGEGIAAFFERRPPRWTGR